jgi:hypothetical protein
MATARQIEANRSNAQKSTGPRTAEGKAASRRNAFKHGLASVHVHEDLAEFQEFRASLVQTWMPADAKEMMLVDLIADGWWRMARSNRYESELLANEIEEMKRRNGLPVDPHPRDDRGVALMMAQEQYDQAFKTLFRYSDRATSKYFRALAQLEKMQRARRRDEERGAIPTAVPEPFTSLPVPDQPAGLASFGEAQEAAVTSKPAPVDIAARAASGGPELGSFGETTLATGPAPRQHRNQSCPDAAPCTSPYETPHSDLTERWPATAIPAGRVLENSTAVA